MKAPPVQELDEILIASELAGGGGVEEVYLDVAGAALPPLSLLRAVAEDMTSQQREGNPHTRGEQRLDEARALVLDHFSASPDVYSVVFSSGATQSLKIVAESFTFGEAGCLYHPLSVHTSVLGMRSFAPRVASFPTAMLFSPAPASSGAAAAAAAAGEAISSSSLIVIPGECNFDGSKVPIDEAARWAQHLGSSEEALEALGGAGGGRLFWLLDAAKLAATSPVCLSSLPVPQQPDFVVASFYKIFGYPTGLGVLLVKRSAAAVLGSKLYYGGGTVLATSAEGPGKDWVVPRPDLSDRLQDGTPHFQGIASLRRGFEAVRRMGGMAAIQLHASRLARRLAHSLACLRHPSSSAPVCRVLGRHFKGREEGGEGGEEGEEGEARYISRQGPVVAFCVFWADGTPVGHSEVVRLAQVEEIFLRGGCCCNPGACQEALGLTHDDLKSNLLLGRTCAGEDSAGDVVNGRHTGVVRASLGWSSRESDCHRLVGFLLKFFVGGEGGDSLLSRRLSTLPVPAPTPTPTPASASASAANAEPEPGMGCVLSEVSVYPIKSCGAVRAARWALSSGGLLLDREWVVVDSAGRALTQKTYPSLSLVRPFVDVARGLLVVTAPDLDPLELLLPTDDPRLSAALQGCIALDAPPPRGRSRSSASACMTGPGAGTRGAASFSSVSVCGLRRPAHQQEGEMVASQWFSTFLGTPCFVMRRRLQGQSQSDAVEEGEDGKTFSNEAPLLVVNESSVAIHLSHMGSAGNTTTVNFRPNFVLRGGEPFCEDNWASIDFVASAIKFKVAGPCQRCSVININGSTGAVDGRALASLAEFRRSRGKSGAIHFGLFLSLSHDLRERVGKGELIYISRFSSYHAYSSSVHE